MLMMLDRLGKLKGRSAGELHSRLGQAVAAWSERRRWSDQTLLSYDAFVTKRIRRSKAENSLTVSDLFENFKSRRSPRFFSSLDDIVRTRTVLAGLPGSHNLCARAERIVSGKFDLLGLRDVTFGNPIDKLLEPISGKRSPLAQWGKVPCDRPDVCGDKKITWELSRNQHFQVPGRAYLLSGDDRYASVFVRDINEWIDQNPPKLGINWASSLEIAIRSIAWIWTLCFFRHSTVLRPELFNRVYQILYLKGRHLETHLSTYFSPNTHLTGEALGLVYLGLLFPAFDAANRWLELGLTILFEQLPVHVRRDGVYFEQTTYYHRYTTDFYLHLTILAERNGVLLPQTVRETLTFLLDHLMYVARPDGTTPFIGDDDGGRVAMLSEYPTNDFRSTLAVGAALLGRGEYKFAAPERSEEMLWLLGPEGVEGFEALAPIEPVPSSRGFDDGGYYVMRDSWSSKANYVLFDSGPHRTANGGHAHADALAVEVSVRCKALLVDPGTYSYTGCPADRNWFRCTAAHNTLTVDGLSSSEPSAPFMWHSAANALTKQWVTTELFDFVSGSHRGAHLRRRSSRSSPSRRRSSDSGSNWPRIGSPTASRCPITR